MKVKLSAWSERYNGCTEFCVAVSDGQDLYKIFSGRNRSNQQAYQRALEQAQAYMQQHNLELESQE